jgi:hypothetical protein
MDGGVYDRSFLVIGAQYSDSSLLNPLHVNAIDPQVADSRSRKLFIW